MPSLFQHKMALAAVDPFCGLSDDGSSYWSVHYFDCMGRWTAMFIGMSKVDRKRTGGRELEFAVGMMSNSKILEKRLGGKWTYSHGGACWECDDGRVVRRCSAGVDEFDNPVGPAQYWLYEDGKAPRRAEEFMAVKELPFRLGGN